MVVHVGVFLCTGLERGFAVVRLRLQDKHVIKFEVFRAEPYEENTCRFLGRTIDGQWSDVQELMRCCWEECLTNGV